uniref:Uncharacterized protein n=1 Tax=Theileria annulata TaxID=5874 RepID=A0A3B0MR74_THEAN
MTGICLPEPYNPNTQVIGQGNTAPNFADKSKQLTYESLKKSPPKYASEYNVLHEPISTIRLSNSVSDTHRLGRNVYQPPVQRRTEEKSNPNHLKNNLSYSTKYDQLPVAGVKIPVSGMKRVGIPNKLSGVSNRNRGANYESLTSRNFNDSFTTNCEYLERMSSIDSKDFVPFETNDPDFLRNLMYYEKLKMGLLDSSDKDQTQVKSNYETRDKLNDVNNRKQNYNENLLQMTKPQNKSSQIPKSSFSRDIKNKSEECRTDSKYYELSKGELCNGIASIGLALSKVFRLTGSGVLFLCSSLTDNLEELITSHKQKDNKNDDRSYINDIRNAMASMYDKGKAYNLNSEIHHNESSGQNHYKCQYPCSSHDHMNKDLRHVPYLRDTFNPKYGVMRDHYNQNYNLRESQGKMQHYQENYGINKGLDTRHTVCHTDYDYDKYDRPINNDYNNPIILNNIRIDYDSDLDDFDNKNTFIDLNSNIFSNFSNGNIGVGNLDYKYENKPDVRGQYDLKTSIPVSNQRNPVSNFKFTNSPMINMTAPNDRIGPGANRIASDMINSFDFHKTVDQVQMKKTKAPQEHFAVPSVVGYGSNNAMPPQTSPEHNQNDLSLLNTPNSTNSQNGNIIIRATRRPSEVTDTSSSSSTSNANTSSVNTTSDTSYNSIDNTTSSTSSSNITSNTSSSNITSNTSSSNITSNTSSSNTDSSKNDNVNNYTTPVYKKYNNEEERINEIKKMEVKHGLNIILQEQQKKIEAETFSDTEVEPNEIELKKKAKKKMFIFSRK